MSRPAIIANLRYPRDLDTYANRPGYEPSPFIKLWSRVDVMGQAEGAVVMLGLTGAQVMSDPRQAARLVCDAVEFAQVEIGAEVVGLTSLTSSVTMRGEWLCRQPGIKAALTHGDSYAVALTLDGLSRVAEKTGRPLADTTVAIVGAYGLIGRAVSLLLAQTCARLILVGPNEGKLGVLRRELPAGPSDVVATTDLRAVADAHTIVTATSNPDALITAAVLGNSRHPVVIYEVSVPPNLPRLEYERLRSERPNVVKVDGAMAAIPGVDVGFSAEEVPDGHTFACWAETMMQALENDCTHHIGAIDLEHVHRTREWAGKYGFGHAPFTCFGELVPDKAFQ